MHGTSVLTITISLNTMKTQARTAICKQWWQRVFCKFLQSLASWWAFAGLCIYVLIPSVSQMMEILLCSITKLIFVSVATIVRWVMPPSRTWFLATYRKCQRTKNILTVNVSLRFVFSFKTILESSITLNSLNAKCFWILRRPFSHIVHRKASEPQRHCSADNVPKSHFGWLVNSLQQTI